MRACRLSLFFLFSSLCFSFPLSFEQRDASRFLARYPNGFAELRPDRIHLNDVTLRFLNATKASRMEGLGTQAPSTYLRQGVARTFPQFPRLAIHHLYTGVDAVFYGSGDNLEYDLQLARGASPNRVRLAVDGARGIELDDAGNLVIHSSTGILRQMRPRVFQGSRQINARYVLLTPSEVGIRLGKYDHRSALTIDPVLASVKTLGSTGLNAANLIATDAQGNVYAAGQSVGVDFPTTPGSLEPAAFPPLRILSNAGETIRPTRVGNAISVGLVAGSQDERILYAATSQGLQLSTDSGANWRPTAAFPIRTGGTFAPGVAVNAISIDTLDPATILVATSVGLYGTNSAGQIWGERNTGLNVSASGYVSVASVMYHPFNPLIAYAVTSGPSYVFASSDAGNTWRRLDPTYPGEPPAPGFSFSPNQAATLSGDGNLLYVVNGNGTLLRSPDGGSTWTKLAQGFFAPSAIRLDPKNASTLYVLDQRGLYKSTDSGQTFSRVGASLDIRGVAIDSAGAIYVNGLSSIVYISTDGASAFKPIPGLTNLSTPTLSAAGTKLYAGGYSPYIPFIVKLDPSGTNILYSTFFGGSTGDGISALTVDAQGNAVVAGAIRSTDFPLTVPASSPPGPSKSNGFVAKLNADGTRLLYSVPLATSQSVTIKDVTLDSSGAVYLTGQTYGTDLPTTANAFQAAAPTPNCPRPPLAVFGPEIPLGNAFVSKISTDGGSPIYTTLLTGSCGAVANAIAVDAGGNAIVVGYTTSPDFPVSSSSYQPAFPGSTDPAKPPLVLTAGFVAKLSPGGDKLLAGTYLGGGYSTSAGALTLDAAGSVYITGFTQGFATAASPGAYRSTLLDKCTPTISIGPGAPYTGSGDAFVLKLDPALSRSGILTYFGGSCSDTGNRIALDPAGNIWLGGSTASPDFPLKDAFQASQIVSQAAGFVSELNPDASQLLFSSFAPGTTLALGPSSVYLAGSSGASAVVAKIDTTKSPAIGIDAVAPVIGFPPVTIGPFFPGVAPGQLIQIRGRNLGPATEVAATLDATGRLPFVLGNTVVFFDNIPAPLLSVGASSITCYVPFEVVATAQITVRSNGQVSNPVAMGIGASAPQILKVLNADGSINATDRPAKAGSVIAIYLSGLGQTNPPSADGLVNAAPFGVPLVSVGAYVAGTPVTPQFAGAAPGMIAGITQVNVQVPASAPAGINPLSVNSAGAALYVGP